MPTFGAGIAQSGTIADNAVTTAKVADDAVTTDKIAQGTSAQVLMSNADPATTWTTISGDVTVGATGVTAIGAAKVTEAMQVLADNTTNDVSSAKHGYVPKVPNNTTTFLRGDATFATPTGGGVTHKASGTIALQAATTTAGTDFATISFSAAEMAAGDIVEIYLQGVQAAQNLLAQVDLLNTTSDPTGTALTWATGGIEGHCFFRCIQSAQDTSIMSITQWNPDKDQSNAVDTYGIDSGDDNLFTTAFDIRVSVYNSSSSNARTIRYKVIILKSS